MKTIKINIETLVDTLRITNTRVEIRKEIESMVKESLIKAVKSAYQIIEDEGKEKISITINIDTLLDCVELCVRDDMGASKSQNINIREME
jgi:hypothetical protein